MNSSEWVRTGVPHPARLPEFDVASVVDAPTNAVNWRIPDEMALKIQERVLQERRNLRHGTRHIISLRGDWFARQIPNNGALLGGSTHWEMFLGQEATGPIVVGVTLHKSECNPERLKTLLSLAGETTRITDAKGIGRGPILEQLFQIESPEKLEGFEKACQIGFELAIGSGYAFPDVQMTGTKLEMRHQIRVKNRWIDLESIQKDHVGDIWVIWYSGIAGFLLLAGAVAGAFVRNWPLTVACSTIGAGCLGLATDVFRTMAEGWKETLLGTSNDPKQEKTPMIEENIQSDMEQVLSKLDTINENVSRAIRIGKNQLIWSGLWTFIVAAISVLITYILATH